MKRIIILFVLFSAASLSAQDTLTFPSDVNNLQKAADQLPEGGTLQIKPGTYYLKEPVRINKTLKIVALNPREETVLEAAKSECIVLTESGKNTTVNNVTLRSPEGHQSLVKPVNKSRIVVPTDVADLAQAVKMCEEGGTVVLEKGLHRISKVIVIDKDITIVGPEMKYIPEGVVHCTDDECFLITDGTVLFERIGCNTNEYTEGEEYGSGAVRISGGNVKLRNVLFVSTKSSGLVIEGPVMYGLDMSAMSLILATTVSAENSSFLSGQHENARGVSIYGGKSVKFDDCSFGGDYVNVDIWNGAKPTFTNCRIKDAYKTNISVQGNGTNPTFKNCEIANGKTNAIICYNNAKGLFEDCNIHDYHGGGLVDDPVGVYIYGGADPTFRRCTITKCMGYGVSIENGGKGRFEACSVQGNSYNYRNGLNWSIESTAGNVIRTNRISSDVPSGKVMESSDQTESVEKPSSVPVRRRFRRR